MPTGILSIDQIDKAEQVLEYIAYKLENNILPETYSSETFYEMIPYNGISVGFRAIDDKDAYNSKIEILKRIRSAVESLSNGKKSSLNPIEYFASDWLRSKIEDITDVNNDEYKKLKICLEKTQHPNEDLFNVEKIFKVHSDFKSDLGNHLLLIHFTFPSNILNILREGLLVSPNHVPSQNNFYGRGVYFWDTVPMALEAFRNSYPSAIFLVCRVAMGQIQETGPRYLAKNDEFPFDDGANSLFRPGTFSESREEQMEINGAIMHCGKINRSVPNQNAQNPWKKNQNSYNLYLAREKEQINLEYIVQLNNPSVVYTPNSILDMSSL